MIRSFMMTSTTTSCASSSVNVPSTRSRSASTSTKDEGAPERHGPAVPLLRGVRYAKYSHWMAAMSYAWPAAPCVSRPSVVLDRLLDLLLIAVLLRAASQGRKPARPAGTARKAPQSSAPRSACCTTTRPTRGRCRPGQETGVSRAAFARRFTDLGSARPVPRVRG